MDNEYFVCWQSRTDPEFKGRGSTAINVKAAKAWMKNMNEQHPDIKHWIKKQS
jgi:hypothetical protein